MADQTATIRILLEQAQQVIQGLAAQQEAIRQLRGEAEKLGQTELLPKIDRLDSANKKLGETGRRVSSLTSSFNAVKVAVSGFIAALAVRRLSQFIAEAVRVKVVFDGIEQTLKAVTKTTGEYDRAQKLVLDTSRRLGLQIVSLGRDYANFLASTKRLDLSQQQIEKIFTQVAEAGRVLNLSQQRLNLTFLALSQIASKGIACVDTDTEILTKLGWLKWDQISVGDLVAGYDLATRETLWQPVLSVWEFGFDGEAVFASHRGAEVAMIPAHRVVELREGAARITRASRLMGREAWPVGQGQCFGLPRLAPEMIQGIERRQWQGRVWCPETPTQTWIARKGAFVFVTGNTMEELRRQLGDQLPGVFSRVADAMGLTTTALIDQIRQGKILAEEILPAIGAAAEALAGGQAIEASKKLQAQLSRLSLEAQLAQKSFVEAAEEGISKFVKALTQVIKDSPEVVTALGAITGALADQAAGNVKAAAIWVEFFTLMREESEKTSKSFTEFDEKAAGFVEKLTGLEINLDKDLKPLDVILAAINKNLREGTVLANEEFQAIEDGSSKALRAIQELALEEQRRVAARAEAARKAAEEFEDFKRAIEEQAAESKRFFQDQTQDREAALSRQRELESAQTAALITEFEQRAAATEILEKDRVEVVKEVSEELIDLEKEISEERIKIAKEAVEEGEKATAAEREEILKESAEKLLEIEQELQEKREEIVEKGAEKLLKLEQKRAEFVRKELEKIGKAEEKLAKKREELLEESLKKVREFFAAQQKLFQDPTVGVDTGNSAQQLQDLQKELQKLQFSPVRDEGAIDALKQKILDLKAASGSASESFTDLSNSLAKDSAIAREQLDKLVNTEAFRTKFESLSESSKQFALSAIRDFETAADSANVNQDRLRQLEEVFRSLGLTSDQAIGGIADSLDRLADQPTETQAKLQELAERTKELGGAADAAGPALDKVKEAVDGVAERSAEAATGVTQIGEAFAGSQESISGAATDLTGISDTLPAINEGVLQLATDLPPLLESLTGLVEDEILKTLGADITALLESVDSSQEGLQSLTESIEALVKAGEDVEKITQLSEAITSLSSEENVENLKGLSENLKAVADGLEEAGSAAEKFGDSGGPLAGIGETIANVQEKIEGFLPTLEALVSGLGRAEEIINGMSDALQNLRSNIEETGQDIDAFSDNAVNRLNLIGASVDRLIDKFTQLNDITDNALG